MRPFVASPFFVANPLQAGALVRLRQAATFPGGLAVLSGGPGVGKSALLRQALAPVAADVHLAPVDLRGYEPADLSSALLAALDGGAAGTLRPALGARRAAGQALVIALDISGLNVELARRLLRFMHAVDEQQAPVSLVLMGPHTLHPLLDVAGLIQLRQRLSFRLKLRPLTLLETAGYLRHCLAEAGAAPDEVLAVNAPAAVYLYVAGVPRLVNTLMDAALGEAQLRQAGKVDAELIRQVAEQLGWKPIGARGVADLVRKPAATPTRPTADRPAQRQPRTEVPPPPPAEPLPESEATRRLLAGAAPMPAPAQKAAAAEAPAPERRGAASPPIPMDETDTGATGMLRLEDLDERFAETLFSEDSGHFKALVDASRAD